MKVHDTFSEYLKDRCCVFKKILVVVRVLDGNPEVAGSNPAGYYTSAIGEEGTVLANHFVNGSSQTKKRHLWMLFSNLSEGINSYQAPDNCNDV